MDSKSIGVSPQVRTLPTTVRILPTTLFVCVPRRSVCSFFAPSLHRTNTPLALLAAVGQWRPDRIVVSTLRCGAATPVRIRVTAAFASSNGTPGSF
ncbi:hypothetical protein G5714_020146 [Onychostoma macrolepis]|uniref:Uncharacterized protein n=1 Tax=Onychostoma macrolepis TaxID=369639 RepID=A0A7J6BYI6_9TELE|nr:hypothetical protein G5714_020146 [Onychostoma macrolepis]